MRKYSFLRKYYPFILLLAGIAILYYFINTTEGFESSKKVSVYLYGGKDNAVKFAGSTDEEIVNLNKPVKSSANVDQTKAGIITLNLPNYLVSTYNVSAYGINCSNKPVKDPKTGKKQLAQPENPVDKNAAYWFTIDNTSSIGVTGTDIMKKNCTFDNSSWKCNATTVQNAPTLKTLTITGLTAANLGLDINNILTTNTNYGITNAPTVPLANAANIRIDLTITPVTAPVAAPVAAPVSKTKVVAKK